MKQSRTGIPVVVFLALIALPAAPVAGADAPAKTDPRATNSSAEPVFYVEQNVLTPVIEKYLETVREKIQQRGSRDWPEDIGGTKIPGEVFVQIVLKKNGYIKELRTSVTGEGAAGSDASSLSAAVEVRVRNAQPFAPFPPRTFTDYEFVSLGATVTPQPDSGKAGADGQGQK